MSTSRFGIEASQGIPIDATLNHYSRPIHGSGPQRAISVRSGHRWATRAVVRAAEYAPTIDVVRWSLHEWNASVFIKRYIYSKEWYKYIDFTHLPSFWSAVWIWRSRKFRLCKYLWMFRCHYWQFLQAQPGRSWSCLDRTLSEIQWTHKRSAFLASKSWILMEFKWNKIPFFIFRFIAFLWDLINNKKKSQMKIKKNLKKKRNYKK